MTNRNRENYIPSILDYLVGQPRVVIHGLRVTDIHKDILSESVEVELEGGLHIQIPVEPFASAPNPTRAAVRYLADRVLAVLLPSAADESVNAPEVLQDEVPEWTPEHDPRAW